MTQNDFYSQLNSLGNFNPSRPMSTIGLGVTDHYASGAGHAYRSVFYNQILPQNISINDSINCTTRGFTIGAALGRALFRKAKIFNIYIGIGINAGRIKLYKKDYINKFNPILTPKITFKPTVFIKRIYLNLNVEYDYDFVNSNWINVGNNQLNDFNVAKLNNSSLTATFGIGCFLRKQN